MLFLAEGSLGFTCFAESFSLDIVSVGLLGNVEHTEAFLFTEVHLHR